MDEIVLDPEDRDLLEYDLTLLWHGRNSSRYVVFLHNSDARLFGTRFIHKVILERKLGRKLYSNMVGDHINRNKFDNRRDNLREATRSMNIRNSKLRCNNVSGFRGISSHGGKWQAAITVDKNKTSLGTYGTKEEAYKAYLDGCIRYNVELPPEAREGENYAENTEESTQNELQSGKDWKTCLD